MKQNIKYYFLLLLPIWLVSGIPLSLSAQEEDITVVKKDFDKEKWRELTDGLDYSVDKVKERKNRKPVKVSNTKSLEPLLKIIGIIIFIGLIVLLLYRLLDGNSLFKRRDKMINSKISAIALQELEENLPDSDVNSLIQEAINNGEFTLAIRLSYLAVIKELSTTKKLTWKKNKTNRHYIRELRDTSYFTEFKELTSIFERIWYGNKSLDSVAFKPVYKKFTDFIKKVNF